MKKQKNKELNVSKESGERAFNQKTGIESFGSYSDSTHRTLLMEDSEAMPHDSSQSRPRRKKERKEKKQRQKTDTPQKESKLLSQISDQVQDLSLDIEKGISNNPPTTSNSVSFHPTTSQGKITSMHKVYHDVKDETDLQQVQSFIQNPLYESSSFNNQGSDMQSQKLPDDTTQRLRNSRNVNENSSVDASRNYHCLDDTSVDLSGKELDPLNGATRSFDEGQSDATEKVYKVALHENVTFRRSSNNFQTMRRRSSDFSTPDNKFFDDFASFAGASLTSEYYPGDSIVSREKLDDETIVKISESMPQEFLIAYLLSTGNSARAVALALASKALSPLQIKRTGDLSARDTSKSRLESDKQSVSSQSNSESEVLPLKNPNDNGPASAPHLNQQGSLFYNGQGHYRLPTHTFGINGSGSLQTFITSNQHDTVEAEHLPKSVWESYTSRDRLYLLIGALLLIIITAFCTYFITSRLQNDS